MIVDTLAHMDTYKGLDPRLYQALETIRDTDFSCQADGEYEVDGFGFRYILQSYTTRETNDTPEAHRDFIDVQYIISGHEVIAAGQLDKMEQVVESHLERDIWLYHGPVDPITLDTGYFAIFFPQDAHAPRIASPAGPAQVRKCLFKVHI